MPVRPGPQMKVRKRIAAYLRTSGPVWGDVAAKALGLTLGRWWIAVGQCPWFTFEGKSGEPLGWRLTAKGEREAG